MEVYEAIASLCRVREVLSVSVVGESQSHITGQTYKSITRFDTYAIYTQEYSDLAIKIN